MKFLQKEDIMFSLFHYFRNNQAVELNYHPSSSDIGYWRGTKPYPQGATPKTLYTTQIYFNTFAIHGLVMLITCKLREPISME
jgi:hypothetical protein